MVEMTGDSICLAVSDFGYSCFEFVYATACTDFLHFASNSSRNRLIV